MNYYIHGKIVKNYLLLKQIDHQNYLVLDYFNSAI
jgi:hypothetical protein